MDNNQPRNEPVQPWEYIFDAVLLTGAFVLIWQALAVAGIFPPVPGLGYDPEVHANLNMYFYVMAVIGLSEYGLMHLLLSRPRRDPQGNIAGWDVRLRAIMRMAFAGAVWIYILILYYLMHPA